LPERAAILAINTTDPLTLQSIPPVLRVIDWRKQSSQVVDWWIAYIGAVLEQSNDAAFLAEAALFSISRPRPGEAMSLARAKRPGSRTVVLLAIFEGAAAELSEDEATSVAHSLTVDLRGIREAAARRSFSFGSSYDAGALLAELLLARPELPTRSMKRMTRSPTTPAANVFYRLRESDLS
jgi:hypothetical protein